MSDAKFSLKVMIDKSKSKVLFAEAGSHFADILLSFLTLPLGRILKVIKKHYGDNALAIGSLSSLYNSLVNLGTAHFWTDGAKKTLLDPPSSFQVEHERLRLDVADSPPAEYFLCSKCPRTRFRSVSIYYDQPTKCKLCGGMWKIMSKEEADKMFGHACGTRVFTHKASFIISDDLHMFPNETGFLQTITILGITDSDKAEPVTVDFGMTEVMDLLKVSLTSPTPLSDVILNRATHMEYSAMVRSQPVINAEEGNPNPNPRNLSLKVIIQKSSGKFLYAQAKEDFVEFLFSFLCIPVGGVEHLLAGKTCIKAIDNLYGSAADLIDNMFFTQTNTKERLTKPKLAHGCISEDHILPLTVESLPDGVYEKSLFHHVKFPEGMGSYLEELQSYMVTDDLTITPFCFVSVISRLNEQRIPISDVEEMELEIGSEEGLSILKASLTSTFVFTDALLNPKPNKKVKREV